MLVLVTKRCHRWRWFKRLFLFVVVRHAGGVPQPACTALQLPAEGVPGQTRLALWALARFFCRTLMSVDGPDIGVLREGQTAAGSVCVVCLRVGRWDVGGSMSGATLRLFLPADPDASPPSVPGDAVRPGSGVRGMGRNVGDDHISPVHRF